MTNLAVGCSTPVSPCGFLEGPRLDQENSLDYVDSGNENKNYAHLDQLPLINPLGSQTALLFTF